MTEMPLEHAGRETVREARGREKGMDWKDIAGDWKSLNAPVREQWTKLTVAHLDAIAGSRELLIGTIRQLYAISQEQSEKQVAAWAKRLPAPAARGGGTS